MKSCQFFTFAIIAIVLSGCAYAVQDAGFKTAWYETPFCIEKTLNAGLKIKIIDGAGFAKLCRDLESQTRDGRYYRLANNESGFVQEIYARGVYYHSSRTIVVAYRGLGLELVASLGAEKIKDSVYPTNPYNGFGSLIVSGDWDTEELGEEILMEMFPVLVADSRGGFRNLDTVLHEASK